MASSLEGMGEAQVDSSGELIQLARSSLNAPLVVVGAPGSGKSSLLRERIRFLVEDQGIHPDQVRLLTPSRGQANLIRDDVGLALGKPTRGSLVKSVAAFAFDIVRHDALERGAEAPRLRSGAEVDEDIASVLAEQLRSGGGPPWPEALGPAVRALPAFRTELRELMARATEYGLEPEDLRRLSRLHPAWAAAAEFVEDYRRVVARSRPHEFDTPELLRLAASLVEAGYQDRPALRAVLVDDVQDFSPASLSLLDALANSGVHLSVCGEPDVASHTFRGSEPEGLARLAQGWGVNPVVLPTVYRHGPTLRHAVAVVTQRVGSALAGSQRKAPAVASDSPDPFVGVISPSAAREARDIAQILHDLHDRHDIAYQEMAVVVRRSADIAPLARALRLGAVPVDISGRFALSDHPASRELVLWVLAAISPDSIDEDIAVELVTGLYGRCDLRWVRRLRRALRFTEATEQKPQVTSLASLLGEHHPPIGLPQSLQRDLARIWALLGGIRQLPPESSAAVLLSHAWQLSGLEAEWSERAEHPESPSLFFAQSLLQVGALVRSAERFHDSHHGVSAQLYLESVLRADVDEDVVMPELERLGVSVLTPAAIAGREWDVVVLAGLNEHVWPNTRLRGSLLGAPLVARVVRGSGDEPIDEGRIVLDDELRMAALSMSRAKRHLIISAVNSEDRQPSALFNLLAPLCQIHPSQEGGAGSSRELVGQFRRALLSQHGDDPDAAAALVTLAKRGVPGADPSQWWGLAEASSSAPVFDGDPVPLSPSALTDIESSALDWFLGKVAPEDLPASVGVGSLVHKAMQLAPWGSEAALAEIVDERWQLIDTESAWQSSALRRQVGLYLRALAQYLADRSAEGVELVASEFRFEVAVDDVILRGSVDRIERQPDGSIVVVDLKTGALTSEKDAQADPQLQSYQLAMTEPVVAGSLGISEGAHEAWLLFVRQGKAGRAYTITRQPGLGRDGLEEFRTRLAQAKSTVDVENLVGPRDHARPGTGAPIHRWQRVGTVCGD